MAALLLPLLRQWPARPLPRSLCLQGRRLPQPRPSLLRLPSLLSVCRAPASRQPQRPRKPQPQLPLPARKKRRRARQGQQGRLPAPAQQRSRWEASWSSCRLRTRLVPARRQLEMRLEMREAASYSSQQYHRSTPQLLPMLRYQPGSRIPSAHCIHSACIAFVQNPHPSVLCLPPVSQRDPAVTCYRGAAWRNGAAARVRKPRVRREKGCKLRATGGQAGLQSDSDSGCSRAERARPRHAQQVAQPAACCACLKPFS